jgi:hypothetical protein
MRMKRIRILGLAFVAVFALSVVASSASGSPVFYTKVEFGATASTPVKFSGTVGALFFEGNIGKTKIECSGGTVSGEVTGATTAKDVVFGLKGCKAGTGECNSAGEPEGAVNTNALEGELGDVMSGVPGLRLFDEATGRGGVLLSFTCFGGAVGVKVRDSFIGQLSGASGSIVQEAKFSASHTLKMVEKDGIQKFSLFVGESLSEQLEWKEGEGAYEKSGLSAIVTFTSEGVSNLGFTK